LARTRVVALLALLLFVAGSAAAAPRFGVAEDAPKYADDGGVGLFADFHRVGLTVDRVTVRFDETQPTVIPEQAFLDRMVSNAARAGIQLVFQIYPMHPRAFQGDTAARTDDFAAYVARVARAYPQVKRFLVLNEPNEAYFLNPQIVHGRNVSAAVAETALAKAYDALKAVDPAIDVIGLALSPEANDVTSTSPVRFLAALGRAYRASGRTKPLMDDLGLHLYPKNAATQDDTTHYPWPQTGPSDLGRIEQAFHDAFAGTGQPVPQETAQAVGPVVRLVLDEIGWQVAVRPSLGSLYTSHETVSVTSEARQARIYAALVKALRCNPAVSDVLLFHLIDETDLRRFQSGLERADGSRRPSFTAVASAIRAPAACAGIPVWHPIEGVEGARLAARPSVHVSNGGVKVRPTASEDATAKLALLHDGRLLATATVSVPAHRHPPVFLAARLSPGRYTVVARLTSVLAPGRAQTLSRPLLVTR
jgi:hypothetical protein